MDGWRNKKTNKQKTLKDFLFHFVLIGLSKWSISGLEKQHPQKCAIFMWSWTAFSCAEQAGRTMAESHLWRSLLAPLWCLQSQTDMMTLVTSPWSHKVDTYTRTHWHTQKHTIPHRHSHRHTHTLVRNEIQEPDSNSPEVFLPAIVDVPDAVLTGRHISERNCWWPNKWNVLGHDPR